jgi:transposase
MTNPTLSAIGGRRSRRSWPDEEKQRIVAEAALPGASVADIARRYGVNANLVFNWRKTARAALSAAEPNGLAVCLPANTSSPAAEHCEFMPIGVIGRAEDDDPALVAGLSSAGRRRAARSCRARVWMSGLA